MRGIEDITNEEIMFPIPKTSYIEVDTQKYEETNVYAQKKCKGAPYDLKRDPCSPSMDHAPQV